MSTSHLVTKKKQIESVLAEFLPKLTSKQREALKQISISDTLPKTKVGWCKFLGITRNAYYNWLCQRDWQGAFQTIVRLVNSLYVPTVITNVKNRTKKSDAASRLFLEYTGTLPITQTQPLQIQHQVNIAILADHREELKAIAGQFCRQLMQPKAPEPEVIEGEMDGDG